MEIKEKVSNYSIKDQITVKGITYVMGHNPNAPSPYVTWRKDGHGSYVSGEYYATEVDARQSLFSRALDILSEHEKGNIALSNLPEAAEHSIIEESKKVNALYDIESCLYDAVEHLNMDESVVSEFLNDPEFEAAALHCYRRQDHSYENKALSQSLEDMIRDEFPEKMNQKSKELKAVLKISPEEMNMMNNVLSLTKAEIEQKYGVFEPGDDTLLFSIFFDIPDYRGIMYLSVFPKSSPDEQNTIEVVLYPQHPGDKVREGNVTKVEKTLVGVECLEGVYSMEDGNGYTWSVDLHADERLRRIGQEYVFRTDGEEPEELAHQEQTCRVLRMLTLEENQPLYSGIMWKAQFQDGVVLDVWDHELCHTPERLLDLRMHPAQQKPVSKTKAGIDAQIKNAAVRGLNQSLAKSEPQLDR